MAKFIYDDFAPPTTEVYIPRVLDRTGCLQHDAEAGDPCYSYSGVSGETQHTGICNDRARRAGLNAPIKFSSLVRTSTRNTSSRADG